MDEQLAKKFPNGVLSFYLEIYCKRKGETEPKCTVQREAIKSWTLLNKSEKQFFETKYDEYRNNYKKCIAMHLRNAEPYLKSKVQTNKETDRLQGTTVINNQETVKEIIQDKSTVNINDNVDCLDHSPDVQNGDDTVLDVHNLNHEMSNDSTSFINTSRSELISVPEPTTPKILTGKELFFIIQEREKKNLTWEKLTKKQKRHYQQAVLSIKKNYLMQFKRYLENLSSEQLFNYYRDIVNSM